MIYLYYGTDKIKARQTAQKTVDVARQKHQTAEFFKLNIDNFSVAKLDELIASQGLFYSAFVILVDSLGDNADFMELVLKRIKEIKDSPNFFVFLEGDLNKKEFEKFNKYSQKVEQFKKVEKRLTKKEVLALKGEKIDFFEFANTLGEKNKKQLWTLYQDALMGEVASEEVHAMFFWQVKSMLATIQSNNAVEAGLNPFVFSKAKSYAKNYSEGDLYKMSSKLFSIYHEAHRGQIDFAVALERFILEL